MLLHIQVQQIPITIILITHYTQFLNGQDTAPPRNREYDPNISNDMVVSSNVRNNGEVGEIFAPRSLSISAMEPSCEELRAMWRFSKRQSRASEITNEIPTYRDPFAYNIWNPYYRTAPRYNVRPNARLSSTRPTYGRVLQKEPVPRARERQQLPYLLTDAHHFASHSSVVKQHPRRRVQLRFSGTTSSDDQNAVTAPKGSFQRLKELIWTERAHELAQQRRLEELSARAAALHEVANGQGYDSRSRQIPLSAMAKHNYESNNGGRNKEMRKEEGIPASDKNHVANDKKKHFARFNNRMSSSLSYQQIIPSSKSSYFRERDRSIKERLAGILLAELGRNSGINAHQQNEDISLDYKN